LGKLTGRYRPTGAETGYNSPLPDGFPSLEKEGRHNGRVIHFFRFAELRRRDVWAE
jgi:hypothetical protein